MVNTVKQDLNCSSGNMRDDLMVQQQVANEWQHMVGVICLNQSHRIPVKRVLPKLFKRYPTPEKLLAGRHKTLETILAPCGLGKLKAKRIRGMSKDYLTWDKNDASKLYGIGKYGSDSYEIFYKNNYNTKPTDKELIKYLHNMVGVTNENNMDIKRY
jgi:methyl-CpG-binding domain protein 4